MEINFHLNWVKPGPLSRKTFKSEAASSLFLEYVERISKFSSCHSRGNFQEHEKKPGTKIWLCGKDSKSLGSEELARKLESLRGTGTKKLQILIGGPDGFTKKQISSFNPDFIWSFGPLTLPHELAAVIAAEQIYRAFTILQKLPYHSGH